MSVGERAFGKYVGGEMAGGWHALPALMQGLFGVHRGDMGVAAGRADPTSHHDKKAKHWVVVWMMVVPGNRNRAHTQCHKPCQYIEVHK